MLSHQTFLWPGPARAPWLPPVSAPAGACDEDADDDFEEDDGDVITSVLAAAPEAKSSMSPLAGA